MADKKILGLLNGLAKRDYYADTGVTTPFLKEQLFPDLSEEDFEVTLKQYEGILNNMVYSDMDANQLQAYLTSLISKKQNSITEEQKEAIVKFWNNNKQKLHQLMVEKCTFNNAMTSLKWRVDIDYKDNTQTSEPKVIFDIGLRNQAGVALRDIMFESDAETLDEMIRNTEKIEEAISQITRTGS